MSEQEKDIDETLDPSEIWDDNYVEDVFGIDTDDFYDDGEEDHHPY